MGKVVSFSSSVKQELAAALPENECCRKAMLYGLMLFGRSFSSKSILLQTESQAAAELFKTMAQEICHVNSVIKKTKGDKCIVFVETPDECAKVLDFFGHSFNQFSLKINHSNFNCDDCQKSFFAGAFLACGTICSPQKVFHLEFVVPFMNLSRSLAKLMSEFDLNPKAMARRGYSVLYFKGSDAVSECLFQIGANASAFEIIGAKVNKDFRNKVNRQINCTTANINKTVDAAASQLAAINKIDAVKGLDFLGEELAALARLRLENPEVSLAELAQLAGGQISRSAINHRLKRIEKIAAEL